MPNWTEPFASLDAATLTFSGSGWSALQYGSVVDYEHVMDSHAVHWNANLATPGSNACSIVLQGSLDGTNFYQLSHYEFGSGEPNANPADLLVVVNVMPARYVRAAVALTDSGDVTVTALVVAHD